MQQLWRKVSALVASKTGLCFPPERSADLERALRAAAQEVGSDDLEAFAHSLLASQFAPAHLQVLVRHLTVGETYFWRDANAFRALAQHVIPELVRRREAQRELCVWSAASCTGEEAYSLAILLQQCLVDWDSWQLTILGTDINEAFLQRAAAGVYGEWSFRGVSEFFKQRYFTPLGKARYAIAPEIRRRVRFARHNLLDEPSHLFAGRHGAVDLILCRNVLMYLTPQHTQRVMHRLHRALHEHAWLAVGATETAHSRVAGFSAVNFENAIFFRKDGAATTAPAAPPAAAVVQWPAATSVSAPRKAADTLLPLQPVARAPQDASLSTRALADVGRLDEALVQCRQWLAGDVLDAHAHYLHGMILEELERGDEARRAFRQAIYLDPGMALAHVALGNLARAGGEGEQAVKHFNNALDSLRGAAPDDVLQDTDGLTARQLQGILMSLLASESAI